MKYFIVLTFLLCACFIKTEAALEQIPRQFYVKQHWLSWTTSFDIESDDLKLGTVHRKFFSLSPVKYEFYDTQENLQAAATMRWFSWGATFDIADSYGGMLGSVEQRVFAFFPTFEILSPVGHLMAIAKMNFWGTTYTISDPVTKQKMATLSRSFFRLKDNWTFTLTDPEAFYQHQIDPRLFVLVMAFQTDRDAWAAEARRRKDDQVILNSYSFVGDSQPDEQLLTLKADLKACREQLEIVKPTEEDAARVDEIVSEALSADESACTNHAERLSKGLATLKPLFESDALTLGEKNALLKMFENSLNSERE